MAGLESIWKLVKNLIPPEQVRKAAQNLIESILEQKKDYPLRSGEVAVITFQFEQDGKTWFSLGFVDQENRIVRQENTQMIDELVEKLVKNL